jgi:hypothetical protein
VLVPPVFPVNRVVHILPPSLIPLYHKRLDLSSFYPHPLRRPSPWYGSDCSHELALKILRLRSRYSSGSSYSLADSRADFSPALCLLAPGFHAPPLLAGRFCRSLPGRTNTSLYYKGGVGIRLPPLVFKFYYIRKSVTKSVFTACTISSLPKPKLAMPQRQGVFFCI